MLSPRKKVKHFLTRYKKGAKELKADQSWPKDMLGI